MILTVVAALALTCGTERWAQKVLQDPAAKKIAYQSFSGASVEALREFPAPKWEPQLPRQQTETIVYKVQALLIGMKLEADEDFHVVIADTKDPSHTMIVEIPSADCLADTAPDIRDRILAARAALKSRWRVAAKFKRLPTPLPVTVTGVLFFDKPHGQTGVAPNAVELHPVLDLSLEPADK